MRFAMWKKPVLKRYALYNHIFMTFQKRQNSRDGEKIGPCQALSLTTKGQAQGNLGGAMEPFVS